MIFFTNTYKERLFTLIMVGIVLFSASACEESTSLCTYGSKTVSVENNTDITWELSGSDRFTTVPFGIIQPFTQRTLMDVPFNIVVRAESSDQDIRELFIDPCVRDYNLIIEN